MQLHCLYVYLWFSEESLYLLPIRIAIALFFFYSCYSSLMSCTILRFVVQAFCINLGTLFLSEINLFPTRIKSSNFHKPHWLIHSFIFKLLLFLNVCLCVCMFHFVGGYFFILHFLSSSYLLCLLIHYYSFVYLAFLPSVCWKQIWIMPQWYS